MRLVAVGVNHSSAPLALRERLSIASGTGSAANPAAREGITRLETALHALGPRGADGFILSTCSRTELYAYAPQAIDPLALFAETVGGGEISADELRDAAYVHVRAAAARHALRVASGLDSLVLGEDQVHAQMKKAIAVAREAGALGPVTERLGAAALGCSKRVRTYTGLSRHAVSLESLAVRSALERVSDLTGQGVIVIGAGESASIILKQLRGAGASSVTIVSRTVERAQTLAADVGSRARVAAATELADALVNARVVFCCTSAPHPVVTPEHLAARRALRGDAPLLCVDLGMPRDVHHAVAGLSGTTVISLESLGGLAEAHRAGRRDHVPAAEAIVDADTRRFSEWLRGRAAVSAVSAATTHADSVVQAELARVLTRLEGATMRDKERIAEMAHRIARKLLHGSIDSMKPRAADDDDTLSILESNAS